VDRLTLTQAARALGVPQHRLIHLCEKRVVVPDLDEARGRGSSRGFSRRNLFEFAVALELRRLELPVGMVRAVLAVLRSFERAAQKTLPRFALPDSLVGPTGLEVSVLLIDGSQLYFTVAKGRTAPTVLGGVDIPRRGDRVRTTRPRRLAPLKARRAIESAKTRTEVNLTRIARALPSPSA
jgi:hypothetical protein